MTAAGAEKEASPVFQQDELEIIQSVVLSLPTVVVQDLLSCSVCIRCILRLLGVDAPIYSLSLLSSSSLLTLLQRAESDCNKEEDDCKKNCQISSCDPLCGVCCGILQFAHKMDRANHASEPNMDPLGKFISFVVEMVKTEAHEFDRFSLEVSLPSILEEKESSICSYIHKKYNSEEWCKNRCHARILSVKECLKLSITSPLKTALGVECGVGCFRISLLYSHTQESCDSQQQKGSLSKKRKADYEGSNKLNGSACENGSADISADDGTFPDVLRAPEACSLLCHCYRTPIYICGRYLKYSRNVSQTCWVIDNERMGEASVEEIIGNCILPVCLGDRYKFHAAGREDLDVRMLGSGRPFLVEIANPHHVPTSIGLEEIEDRLNKAEAKLVSIRGLKLVEAEIWSQMHEGEAEKQKEYVALVWIPRPLTDEDVRNIASVRDMEVLQKTPIRVLHRRSLLERKKIVHWMKIDRIVGNCHYFLLHLCTQAGTYIKEFVHGDLGRTSPSRPRKDDAIGVSATEAWFASGGHLSILRSL